MKSVFSPLPSPLARDIELKTLEFFCLVHVYDLPSMCERSSVDIPVSEPNGLSETMDIQLGNLCPFRKIPGLVACSTEVDSSSSPILGAQTKLGPGGDRKGYQALSAEGLAAEILNWGGAWAGASFRFRLVNSDRLGIMAEVDAIVDRNT